MSKSCFEEQCLSDILKRMLFWTRVLHCTVDGCPDLLRALFNWPLTITCPVLGICFRIFVGTGLKHCLPVHFGLYSFYRDITTVLDYHLSIIPEGASNVSKPNVSCIPTQKLASSCYQIWHIRYGCCILERHGSLWKRFKQGSRLRPIMLSKHRAYKILSVIWCYVYVCVVSVYLFAVSLSVWRHHDVTTTHLPTTWQYWDDKSRLHIKHVVMTTLPYVRRNSGWISRNI